MSAMSGMEKSSRQVHVDDIFESFKLDKGEWVEDISKGETSIKNL